MKCPNCGASASDDAKICFVCGAILDKEIATDIAEAASEAAYNIDELSEEVDLFDVGSKPSVQSQDTALEEMYDKTVASLKKLTAAMSGWIGDKPEKAKEAVKEKYNDIRSDERKTKIALAVIAGIVLALLLLIVFAVSCGSGCTGCVGRTYAGTWVVSDDIADGYSRSDRVFELDRDGKVFLKGKECGTWRVEDGALFIEYDGRILASVDEPGSKTLSLYLYNADEGKVSTSAGVTFVRLSGKTGIDRSEIADLYPDD